MAGTVGRPETDTQISSLMFRPLVDGGSGSQGGRCELVLGYEGYRVGFIWKLALLHVPILVDSVGRVGCWWVRQNLAKCCCISCPAQGHEYH